MTDYLKNLFPNYEPTEDTTVVPYKNYFRNDGGRFTRILNPTGNPKTSGYYQFVLQNHNEEFRHNVESHQINNVGTLCHALLNTLDRYPKWTLPRKTTKTVDDGHGGTIDIELDWSTSFFDTVWANIGDMPVPSYVVPFKTNLTIARSMLQMADSIYQGDEVRVIVHGTPKLTTYSENGYTLNPSTIGVEDRKNDLYTLTYIWSQVDWRTIYMMAQQYDVEAGTLDLMIKSARTMVDLCKKIQYTEIYDAAKLKCKMIEVPATITVDGVTFYRLTFTSQLAADAKYGEARADGHDNVGVYFIREIPSPASVYVDPLMTYDASYTVTAKEVPYMDVQRGRIVYTTVPFSGS